MSTSVIPYDSWQPLDTEYSPPTECCFQPLVIVTEGKTGMLNIE